MAKLVSRRLSAAIARVIAIEKDAGTERLVVCEYAGDPAIDAPDVDAYTEFKLQQRYNVGDGTQAQSEPLPQFQGILFRLCSNVTGKDRSFRRIVTQRLNAEKLLQLRFGTGQVLQLLHRQFDRIILLLEQFTEFRSKIGVDRLLTH